MAMVVVVAIVAVIHVVVLVVATNITTIIVTAYHVAVTITVEEITTIIAVVAPVVGIAYVVATITTMWLLMKPKLRQRRQKKQKDHALTAKKVNALQLRQNALKQKALPLETKRKKNEISNYQLPRFFWDF